MSKPTGPGAVLIDQFIHHVDIGLITANANSSGPAVLERVVGALRSAAAGVRFEDAFDLEWKEGNPRESIATAYAIHPLKERGDSWGDITIAVNRWRLSLGMPLLEKPSLQNLYYKHRKSIEARIHLSELINKTKH